jgi:hypothetical protein
MLAAVCLLATFTISYQTEAVPLERVVKELAAKTGQQLGVSGELSQEIVCLRVRDMAPQECLDQLARCVGAKWERREKELRLVVDTEFDRQQRTAEQSERKQLLKQALARMVEHQKEQGPFERLSARKLIAGFTGDDDRFPDMRSRVQDRQSDRIRQILFTESPAGRLAVRLLLGMNLDRIAEIRKDSSIPFSSKPNSLQQPFGPNVDAALGQLAKEQNAWADYIESLGPNGAGSSPYIGDPRHFTQHVTTLGLKAVLRIEVAQLGYAPQVSLIVTDPNGLPVGHYLGNLGGSYRWDGTDSPFSPAKADKSVSRNPIRISDLARDWLPFLTNGRKNPPSKELLRFILNPEREDPLTEPSRLLLQVSEQRGQNLFACLPDSALGIVTLFRVVPAPSANQLMEAADAYCHVDRNAALLVLRPKNSAQERMERTPRNALGEFARAIHAKRAVGLDDLATFYAAMDSDSSLLYGFLETLVPGGSRAIGTSTPAMIRIYGHMTREQRLALWRGETVSLLNLPEKVSRLLSSAIFYTSQMNGRSIRLQASKPRPNGVAGLITGESTDLLPNGVPAYTAISGESEETAIVLASTEEGMSRVMTADLLASSVLARERPDSDTLYQFNGEDFKGFTTGKRRMMFVKLHVADGLVGRGQLTDMAFDSERTLGFEELPESFRKEYEGTLSALRKQYERIPKPVQKIPPPRPRTPDTSP